MPKATNKAKRAAKRLTAAEYDKALKTVTTQRAGASTAAAALIDAGAADLAHDAGLITMDKLVYEAAKIAASQIYTVTATEATHGARYAELEEFQADELCTGWYWYAEADSCGACAVMAGSLHTVDEGLESHPNCRCEMIPARAGESAEFETNSLLGQIRSGDEEGLAERLGNRTLAQEMIAKRIEPGDILKVSRKTSRTTGVTYTNRTQRSYKSAQQVAEGRRSVRSGKIAGVDYRRDNSDVI